MRLAIRSRVRSASRVAAVAFAAALALDATAQEKAEGEVSFSGHYHVKGVTVQKASGVTRELRGTIILVQKGDSYTSTFDLQTKFPTVNGAVQAQVVGKGEGKVEGRKATGTAQTQILLAEAPGVDPGFAMLQPTAGPRIVSESVAKLGKDGMISIEINSKAAPGQEYAATHTTLKGERMHAAESERWGKPEE
jgi:hypothetical protein